VLENIITFKFCKGRKDGGQKTIFILLFFSFLVFFILPVRSQTSISGIINSYSVVESIDGTQAVTVTRPEFFQPGDTVLIIQMKGMGIRTSPPEDYGRHHNFNNSGNYEFLLVEDVIGKQVVFTREFLKEYNASEVVQLIRVKGYESATVTGTLTASPWDGEKGGVLALMVTNTLTLEADIDVTAIGFRGAMPVTRSSNECSESDPLLYSTMSFPSGSDKAGLKGEGPVSYYLDETTTISTPIGDGFVHGKGRMATGGGGGNGRFSGGGGGANYGQGRPGGNESGDCTVQVTDAGGNGGFKLSEQLRPGGIFINRFFMGGGGGGSTGFAERNASAGGSGGGIVIIVANLITGSTEHGIYADGGSVDLAATAGAGGGGGGGAIIMATDKYSGEVNLYARGGKGGNVDHDIIAGPGGGGGGGYIAFPGETLPVQVRFMLEAGAGGTNIKQNDPHGSANGSPGGEFNELEISLNGLLFNGIKTETTTICEEMAPNILEGTFPRGGQPGYTFEWFSKTKESSWILIEGANQKDYQPGPLQESTSYIRVVKDQDVDPVIDTSNFLTITVHPKIQGNLIIPDEQTTCEGTIALPLAGGSQLEGGTGIFNFLWIRQMISGNEWEDAPGVNNQDQYDEPMADSTWFKRVATSGACTDSSNSVMVNVHPAITNNILIDGQVLCSGQEAREIIAEEPAGGGLGAGTYLYTWEKAEENTWSMVDGNDTPSHILGIPDRSVAFRRIVESGACRDVSPAHTITVLPLITGNTIIDDQVICYNTTPDPFTGSDPVGGDGIFRYIWEKSTSGLSGWLPADNDNNLKHYHSTVITDTVYFRRLVYSGLNDVCGDTSNMAGIVFHPFSYAEVIEKTDTICVGEKRDIGFILSGQGPWNLTFTNGFEDYSAVTGSSPYLHAIQPAAADSINYFYWIKTLVDKNGCIAPNLNLKGEAIITVYAFPEPAAVLGEVEICGMELNLDVSPGFGKGHWESGSASGFHPRNDDPKATVTVSSYGTHEFSWKETNWKCPAIEDVVVRATFYEQPASAYAGEDLKLNYIFEAMMMAEIPSDIPTAHGTWTLLEGTGNILFPEDPSTIITDMKFGTSKFLWTVYNGVCEPVHDTVTVSVNDLDAPTAFSPNNSGRNDRFVIRGIENSSTSELTIFNRQGNLVYKTVNYNNDWDGKNQNGKPLPEDTYYYILKVDNHNLYKGFIVLKR
jgi:gliding motility-associated-like protein